MNVTHLWRCFCQRMWVPTSNASLELRVSKNNHHSAEKRLSDPTLDTKSQIDAQSLTNESQKETCEEFRLTGRHVAALAVLMSAISVCALDYSATGNIMGTVAADLHGSTSQTEWIGNGYSLAACVSQLPISSLSDVFGRRGVFITVLGLFFLGSLVCATAPNMEALIAGRVIQGAGGGGCLVLPEVILADTIPLRQRTMYYSILMVFWALFSGTAPMIAGALSEYSTWRWFFYMNLFIVGGAAVASPFSLKLKHHDQHWLQQLKTIDYGGAILIVGSTVSFLLALSYGGASSELPWSHWSVLVPLILGAAGFIITAAYEYFRKPTVPMFDFRVFGNTSAAICYVHNVLQGIVNMATIYFLPTFFQGVKGYSLLASGAMILPINLIGLPFSFLVGQLVQRTGHYHLVNLAMWGLATLGLGLFTTISETTSLAALICIQIPGSIGINCLYATLSTTANAVNPPHLWTESTAMMSFCRSIGDALGTAIGGAILASQLRTRIGSLSSQGLHIPDSASVLTISSVIQNMDNPETKQALVKVVSQSMQTLFVTLTVFCGAGFLLTLFQEEFSLDQDYESKQGIDQN